MFTAWDHVRTLSPAAGGTLPQASHRAERLLLVPRVPTPGGARLSSVPLELLMEGRGFVSLPRGWRGCCWLGDTPVVTPREPELPPGRGGCPSLCRVAVSFPTITADSLITLLHTADDQQCDSDALQSTEFLPVLWFKCYCYFVGALNSNYSLGLLYSLIVATTVLLLLRICSTITDTIE